jgi:uncharacterized protein YggE
MAVAGLKASRCKELSGGGNRPTAWVHIGWGKLFECSSPWGSEEIALMTRHHLIALAALLALGAAVAPAAAQAPAVSNAPVPSTFALSAFGETRLVPDMASITLGVNTQAATAGEALKANTSRMTTVIAALKKAGLTDRDIQTSTLSINPQYVYENNQPPRLTDYQVANQVIITMHELSRLGGVIDASVAAGTNTAGGISLGLADPSAAEDTARVAAIKALNAKAELFARATGYHIVRLISLNEGGGYAPQPLIPMFAMATRREVGDSTPVSSGELRVRIDVSGVFEVVK